MIRPLLTNRAVKTLSSNPDVNAEIIEGALIINGCAVSSDLGFTEDKQKYQNARYPREEEQGYDSIENLISPGYFSGIITNRTAEIRFAPLGADPEKNQ